MDPAAAERFDLFQRSDLSVRQDLRNNAKTRSELGRAVGPSSALARRH
jgi:hypothetical protein